MDVHMPDMAGLGASRPETTARVHRLAGTLASFSFARAGWCLRQLERRMETVTAEEYAAGVGKAARCFEAGVHRLRELYPGVIVVPPRAGAEPPE